MSGILTSVIPLWARLLFVAFVMVTVAVIADRHRAGLDDTKEQADIGNLQHSFDVRINASNEALIAANAHAAEVEQSSTTKINTAVATQKDKDSDAIKKSNLALAGYLSGAKRVPIDATCSANASGSGAVSSASGAATGTVDTGSAGATLAPAALARLKSRADQVDATAGVLNTCKVTVQGYYSTFGPQPTK